MDAPVNDEESSESYVLDSLNVNNTPNTDHQLMDESMKIEIERMLSTLNERESEILRYYYGLNGYSSHNLKEVGDDMEITHERVRQIKENALHKLQNERQESLLNSYL